MRVDMRLATLASTLGVAGIGSATLASAATYTVHHRIWPNPWSVRGSISTSDTASVHGQQIFSTGSKATYTDTTGRTQPWEGLSNYESASDAFYQLAISPGDKKTVDDLTPITLARVCQLATNGPESFTLHLAENGNDLVALSYDLPGLDASQFDALGCPKDASSTASRSGVEVFVSRPDAPLSLLPPSPPPTKPDGTPLAEGEQPPPEKSFVAKYWMYILPLVLLMVIPTEIADANNEEAENGGGGDSNPFQSGVQKGQRGAAGAR